VVGVGKLGGSEVDCFFESREVRVEEVAADEGIGNGRNLLEGAAETSEVSNLGAELGIKSNTKSNKNWACLATKG
jgi:hypothetical protein